MTGADAVRVPVRPALPYAATVGACLAHAVATHPDRDFIVMPDRRVTFADVDADSAVLASQLLAAGVGKGSRVGLFYTYGPEFVVAWLAALRIGALVMPFSTLATASELRTVLDLGDVQLLLAPREQLGRSVVTLLHSAIPELGDPSGQGRGVEGLPFLRDVWFSDGARAWVCRDGSSPRRVSHEVVRAAEARVVPADLAQVTYTSGSADLPKGVVHSHGALVRNSSPEATRWAMRSVGIPDDPLTVVFCGFPFFWVGGALTLGQALQLGWTVCCLERFDPGLALDLIESEQVERVWAWPSLVQSMRTDPSFANRDQELMGKVLPAPPASGTVVRHRGMSETMGNWFGIEHKVADPATGIEVADGEEGELFVRGFAVMQGYYKVEREDAFDADGWFHTGDRVRRFEGGLQFVGRYTEMIKTRGANVSPREIEVLIESYDEVRHAIVFGLPHGEDEAVTAVLVPKPGALISADAIASRVRESVSSFKVPSRIEILASEDDVPWLATGKPDKRALRRRLLDRTGHAGEPG